MIIIWQTFASFSWSQRSVTPSFVKNILPFQKAKHMLIDPSIGLTSYPTLNPVFCFKVDAQLRQSPQWLSTLIWKPRLGIYWAIEKLSSYWPLPVFTRLVSHLLLQLICFTRGMRTDSIGLRTNEAFIPKSHVDQRMPISLSLLDFL